MVMDLLNPDSVIKTEPGPREVSGGEVPSADTNIDLPGVKKECLQYADSNATASILKTVPIKAELEFREEDIGGILYMESNADLKDIEGECWNSKSDLRTHPGKKPFSCPHCNYSCLHKSVLIVHLRTHTGDKPYSCSDCRHLFSRMGDLKRHMLTHSGNKPFSCPYCNNLFSREGHLKSHLLIHRGEKPYSCSDCHYSFSRKGHLKSHLLTHSGEKPFSCSECKYSCSRNEHLKSHMVSHSAL